MTYIPGGGGGGGNFAQLGDVALNNPLNGQVVSYDQSLGKWTNTAAPGGSSGIVIKIVTAGRTLNASDAGAYIYVEGSGNKTFTMPLLADGAPPVGSSVTLRHGDGVWALTVNATTIDETVQAFHPLNKGNTFSVPEHGTITLIHFRTNAWAVEGVYT